MSVVSRFGLGNIIIGSIEFFLAIIVIVFFVFASRRFAGGIGKGLYLISAGVFFSAISFILGLDDERRLAVSTAPSPPPAWVHETAILLSLVFFFSGSFMLYKTARSIAKENEKPTPPTILE